MKRAFWFLTFLAATIGSPAQGAWHLPGAFHVLTNGTDTRIFFNVQILRSGGSIPVVDAVDEFMVTICDGKLGKTTPIRGDRAARNRNYVMWDNTIYVIDEGRSRVRKLDGEKIVPIVPLNDRDKQFLDVLAEGRDHELQSYLDDLMVKQRWRSAAISQVPGYRLVDTNLINSITGRPLSKARPAPGDVHFTIADEKYAIFMDIDGDDLLYRLQIPGIDRALEFHRFEGEHFDLAKRRALK